MVEFLLNQPQRNASKLFSSALDASQRKDKTDQKLHSEPQRAPKERPVRAAGAQERELQDGPERAPGTPQREYSGGRAPQNDTKIEIQTEAQERLKIDGL